jgi:hypothetical protein
MIFTRNPIHAVHTIYIYVLPPSLHGYYRYYSGQRCIILLIPLSHRQSGLDGLAVLCQLLLSAFLTTLSDGPGEFVGLGGVFVGRKNLGVLASFDLCCQSRCMSD